MNLNLNNHMWPFATVLDGTVPNDSPAVQNTCTGGSGEQRLLGGPQVGQRKKIGK